MMDISHFLIVTPSGGGAAYYVNVTQLATIADHGNGTTDIIINGAFAGVAQNIAETIASFVARVGGCWS